MLCESKAHCVPEEWKKYRVSEQTVYLWRGKYGGMEPNQVSELMRITLENARLKKLVTEGDLEIEVMKEVALKKW